MALPFCSLCVLVFNRYDLLADCLRSVSRGTVIPDILCVVDNGRNSEKLELALKEWGGLCAVVYSPPVAMGVAESWNWFIRNTEGERIISNDDVTFGPDSIKRMLETSGEFVSSLEGTNAFSCFLIRDACVEAVGMFDETISPGYVYFEDCDYLMRMKEVGIEITGVDCGVEHVRSATLTARPPEEVEEHHRRFLIAKTNYLNKWGKLPSGMVAQ